MLNSLCYHVYMRRVLLFLPLVVLILTSPRTMADESLPTSQEASNSQSIFSRDKKSYDVFTRARNVAIDRANHFKKEYLKEKETPNANVSTHGQVLLERAKTIILKQIEAAENHVQALEERTKSSDKLTDAEKSTIASVVTVYTVKTGGYKTAVESAGNLAAVKATHLLFVQETRRLFSLLGASMGLLNATKANEFSGKLGEFAGRVKLQIDAAEKAGADVKKAKEAYDQAMALLELADNKYQEALSKFENAASATNPAEVTAEAHTLLIESNKSLREAHGNLKEAVVALKEVYKLTPWSLE